ncbi:MAG: hypothetical protein AAF762_07970 [Pseudomonadota bacterium]
MSEQDSFITEVSDEVRRDRLFKFFRRYGWIAASLVVVIVAGAAIFEWQRAQAAAEAQAAGDAILAALEADGPAARSDALAALEVSDNANRGALIALMQADAALEQGERDTALGLLQGLADDADLPVAYRDLATLKWTINGAGDVSPDERISRLEGIALGAGAFRLIALEQIALAEVERGNTEAALANLSDIINDAGVTQDLRARALQLIVALGGEP